MISLESEYRRLRSNRPLRPVMTVVLATSVRVAGSDAAEPMAKMTNLSVELAATACRNYSLLPLIEA